MKREILIIGVGNLLRGDDGAGLFVCDQIESLNIIGITTLKVHQLQIELIEEIIRYSKVLVVDAAIGVDDVFIEEVKPSQSGFASSHHTSPGVLKSLVMKLYNRNVDLSTCAIPAFNFELGVGLSDETKSYSETAVEKIKKWAIKDSF